MTEVVVTTGAISRATAKLQSNHHHQQTKTQFFYRPDALPVAQPTVSEHWRDNITFHGLADPKTQGLPTLSLTTNSYSLPWGEGCHLFQHSLTPAFTTMTSLWCNVSVNVVANSNWICLLISAPKVHWRVPPTAARQSGRFNKMLGALRALHVSLNNASMRRTVRKCLKRYNGYLITLQS